jgi:hypothetical protein
MKIARNRLGLATRAFDECLETATVCPTANALHDWSTFVQRCMIFVQLRPEFSQAEKCAGAGKI